MSTITKKEIENILSELSKRRKAFWSEADFQYSFAWILQEKFTDAKIRLERRYEYQKNDKESVPYYIDIWIEREERIYPIELKYKTKKAQFHDCDATFFEEHKDDIDLDNYEKITVMPQGAPDRGRYDYIKDIVRLENISSEKQFEKGFAIILSNDSAYWTFEENPQARDKAFRIAEGNILKGTLEWFGKSGGMLEDGITWMSKNKLSPLTIRKGNSYKMVWKVYSKVHNELNKRNTTIEFRYAITEIKSIKNKSNART